jgi:hypothetical protein
MIDRIENLIVRPFCSQLKVVKILVHHGKVARKDLYKLEEHFIFHALSATSSEVAQVEHVSLI